MPDDLLGHTAFPVVEAAIDAKIVRFHGKALVREADIQVKAQCRANIFAQVRPVACRAVCQRYIERTVEHHQSVFPF
ncbi:hypothetical protein [Paraburkholderia xenovorans]|uniref:hypothetical protein n=1 Tax=Paraburkholderia xenovorans TaxID=36873 RepID=UPI0015C53F69|nr:hypothetical protein [Paraburkholderia xenovorans]NPT39166.1 hypothetical protein [Paraburkholderia xenovorans]